jgi:hypothetical protein
MCERILRHDYLGDRRGSDLNADETTTFGNWASDSSLDLVELKRDVARLLSNLSQPNGGRVQKRFPFTEN